MSNSPASRAEQRTRTIAAYQADAGSYSAATSSMSRSMSPATAAAIDGFVERCGAGARILEIGSGPGHDALALEARGLLVDRTDITPAFVDLLRERGKTAKVLDPLIDDLAGPYDGVWASAVLLHLSRFEAPVVLYRLAQATVPGGWLATSVKVGDGDDWLIRGSIAGARHFTFWQRESWCAAQEAAGWSVVESGENPGRLGDTWLRTLARRPFATATGDAR